MIFDQENWQPDTSLTAILFDCDSTLVKIEGIDELASSADLKSKIKALTDVGMGQAGLTPEIYEKRLALIQPTQQQIAVLGDTYIQQLTEDSANVIQVLQALNKPIYLISAGIYPAVCKLAQYLNIPVTHVMAVQIAFDENGNYLSFDRSSNLTHNQGKREIAASLKGFYKTLALVGDGLNDYAASEAVTRFIGFGGVAYRSQVAELSSFYIYSTTLAPILPLCLTSQEVAKLDVTAKHLYQKGLEAIRNNEVKLPQHKENEHV